MYLIGSPMAAFPAGAGMNRVNRRGSSGLWGVPRRRGDEPAITDTRKALTERSPQARG